MYCKKGVQRLFFCAFDFFSFLFFFVFVLLFFLCTVAEGPNDSAAIQYLFAGGSCPPGAIVDIKESTKVLLDLGKHLFWTTCIYRIPAKEVIFLCSTANTMALPSVAC